MNVSLSAVGSFRTCEQQYYYSRVERLSRRDRGPKLELGVMLHKYLEHYHRGLKALAARETPVERIVELSFRIHDMAWALTHAEFLPKINEYASVSLTIGDQEGAKTLQGLIPRARYIAQRYWLVRGQYDAAEYEFLAVEDEIQVKVTNSIQSVSVVDLLTRSRTDGRVFLWEHKSTESVPEQERRLRDVQTLLYSVIASAKYKVHINAIMWNYLRTKSPTTPKLLQKGGLSRAKDIDTTWQVYSDAISANQLREADYEDMRTLLADREERVFFPRFEIPSLASAKVLLRDYVTTANVIEQRRSQWEAKTAVPVRTIGLQCDWCEFKPICMAVIMGGDAESVIRMRYHRREERHDDPSTVREAAV